METKMAMEDKLTSMGSSMKEIGKITKEKVRGN